MMTTILHNPYGLEHPYEQNAEERFPRQPLAGEKFTVGIVTRPSRKIDYVQVTYQIDGQSPHTVDAVQDREWQAKQEEGVGAEFLERMVRIDQDVWYAQLIAPPHGESLTYWIEADGQRSADFTLNGETWQIIEEQNAAPLQQVKPHVQSVTLRPGAMPQLPNLQQIEWLTDGAKARRVRLTFDSPADESFYGLGERFNALNQRGNVLDIRCYEQYKSQGKRTYFPIPFVLSSQHYGVFVDSNRWMQFDLAATQPDQWSLEADLGSDQCLEIFWLTGDDPFEIVGTFAHLTGKPELPPLWSFGLWMSSNEWNSQARVMQEVDQSFNHDIYPSVLVIEAWSDETTFYIWNDAQYEPRPGDHAPRYEDFRFPADGKWPNPKALVDELHDRQIRLILWQIPVLKKNDEPHAQQDMDRTYFEEQGFGVREADGSFYKVRPFWFQDGYLLDVTHAAANDWWMSKRAYLLDELGIDGFKTDGGEHLWGAETRFADGRHGSELWNLYPRLYTQIYYDFATKKRNGDALTFSRAGFTGSQTCPAHWAGDENSTWEAFRHSIFAGLSAGLSGIPFWGWDIGGFSGPLPSAELYLRSAAMAAFCPIMQYHSEYNAHRRPQNDRTPWNIQEQTGDDRVVSIFRFFTNVRYNLIPYLWQEAQHCVETGQPMMRALQVIDPEASPYQYLLGRDLLVSPIVDEGTTSASVYLPTGTWIDLWTQQPHEGDQDLDVLVPLDRIPVFVRRGARIPVRFGDQKTWGQYMPLAGKPTDILSFI